jgi:hypothetical protein
MDSTHFSSHEERSYPTIAYTGKHLANHSHKLSIISKQSKLILKELRYEMKIHAISDMPRKEKDLANSPQFFFFFLILKKCNMEMTSYAKQDQTCVSSMMPIQKNSRSTYFFYLPQQVAKFSQEKQRAKHNWFLDCIQNIASKMSNQT